MEFKRKIALCVLALVGRRKVWLDTVHKGMLREPVESLITDGYAEARDPDKRYVRLTDAGWRKFDEIAARGVDR